MPPLRDRLLLAVAVGAGAAVGAAATVLLYQQIKSAALMRELVSLGRRLETLTHEVQVLREQVATRSEPVSPHHLAHAPALHLARPASSGDVRGMTSQPSAASLSEDDDMFEDAYGGSDFDSGSTTDEYLTANSSFSSGRSSVTSPLGRLSQLLSHVDTLLNGSDAEKEEAYNILTARLGENKGNHDFLWRLAKAEFNMAELLASRGDTQKRKELVYSAKDRAFKALEVNETDANVHKWCAITIGSVAEYEGTQDKILKGYTFKEHIQRSIELNPKDASSRHLLGRWCFTVYMLSWLERKAAAALFATPPTATVDEALDCFLEADKLNPGGWKENLLYIAKCYIEKRDYKTAVDWLDKGSQLPSISFDDKQNQDEIKSLLYKYEGYRAES